MLAKQVPAPFIPETKSINDLGNIDKMFTREKPSETPEESNYLQKH